MFWNNLVAICNQHSTTPTALVNELGIAGGSVTRWKNGSVPRDTTLKKIADHFGVTTDYLLNGPKADPDDTDEMTELLQELKTRPEMRMLFSLAKGATKEDVELAVAIIQRMRQSGDGE